MERPEEESSQPPLDPPGWHRRSAPISRAEVAAAAIGVAIVLLSWGVWWLGSGSRVPKVEVEDWVEQYRAKLSVNSAEWQELLVIPGVGERTALRIVEERTANGPYSGMEDMIKRVGRLSRDRMARFSQHMDFGPSVEETDPAAISGQE